MIPKIATMRHYGGHFIFLLDDKNEYAIILISRSPLINLIIGNSLQSNAIN